MERPELSSKIYQFVSMQKEIYTNDKHNNKNEDRITLIELTNHYSCTYALEETYRKKYQGVNGENLNKNFTLMYNYIQQDLELNLTAFFDDIINIFQSTKGYKENETKEKLFIFWLNEFARAHTDYFD